VDLLAVWVSARRREVVFEMMLRKVTLLLLTAPAALLIPLGTTAAQPATTIVPDCKPPFIGPEWYTTLWVSACGPSHVIENRNYTYGAVVKNYGKRTFRKLKLSVIHYDPITRSSRPYRRELRREIGGPPGSPHYPPPMMASVWTLDNFKPGQFFRVNITLPFKRRLRGSYFVVEARGYSPHELVGLSKRVVFIKK
jgi:hypothetical protein